MLSLSLRCGRDDGRCYGEGDYKLRAYPLFALNGDRTAHFLDVLLDDPQPEAGAFDISGVEVFGTVETREQMRDFIGVRPMPVSWTVVANTPVATA